MNTTTTTNSTILPNGIDTKGRPIIGIDWGGSTIHTYNPNRQELIKEYPSFIKAAESGEYDNCIWVTESTAESFALDLRQNDLDAMKKHGITTYCFNPRTTARYRDMFGLAKTNGKDAEVIYLIFTTTALTCNRFKQLWAKGSDVLREKVKTLAVEDRCRYQNKNSELASVKYLPSFDTMTDLQKEFSYSFSDFKKLTKRQEKAKTAKKVSKRVFLPVPHRPSVGKLLMLMEAVRQEKRGWRTVRRLVGNYGQGYGGIHRSEFFHHIVKETTTARLKTKGLKVEKIIKNNKIKTDQSPQLLAERKQVMKDADKYLKWLWKLTV